MDSSPGPVNPLPICGFQGNYGNQEWVAQKQSDRPYPLWISRVTRWSPLGEGHRGRSRVEWLAWAAHHWGPLPQASHVLGIQRL